MQNARALCKLLRLRTGSVSSAVQELRWLHAFATRHAALSLPDLVRQRSAGKPLQFILGTQPFGDLSILCEPPVLIPRSETEAWIHEVAGCEHDAERPLRVLDVCTGTGCMGLLYSALMKKRGLKVQTLGVDINPLALDLARRNAERNHLSSTVRFQSADLLSDSFPAQIEQEMGAEGPDVILCNPPYIPESDWRDLETDVKDWEDKLALVGDSADGLRFYAALREHLRQPVFQSATVYMEVGRGQAESVRNMFADRYTVSVVKDCFQNFGRVIKAEPIDKKNVDRFPRPSSTHSSSYSSKSQLTGLRSRMLAGHAAVPNPASFMRQQVRHKSGSERWKIRQSKDPYVKARLEEGYRSRSAFKLEQLNAKYRFIGQGRVVVDLGGAPGGWSQAIVRLGGLSNNGCIVCCDVLPIEPIKGVTTIQADFTTPEAMEALRTSIVEHVNFHHRTLTEKEAERGRLVNVVLSDMAPSFSGIKARDEPACLELYEAAFKFALTQLRFGTSGFLIMKFFSSNTASLFERKLLRHFKDVQIVKPDSSRSGSGEAFWVCRNLNPLSKIMKDTWHGVTPPKDIPVFTDVLRDDMDNDLRDDPMDGEREGPEDIHMFR